MRLIFASCLAVAALSAAAPSFAQTVEELTVTGRPKNLPETASYRVSYGDIDLATPDGVKELDRRVRVAAKYVCSQLNSGLDVDTCMTNAIRDARRKEDQAKKTQPHPFKPGPGWMPPPGEK